MASVTSVAEFSSPLHDADRAHSGDLLRDAGSVHHVDNQVDVFVSVGLLFSETSPALSFGDDTSCCEFSIDASSFGFFDSASSAHQSARSVTGRSESLLHTPRLTGQYPARSTHVAGNEDRLADLLVPLGDF